MQHRYNFCCKLVELVKLVRDRAPLMVIHRVDPLMSKLV